MGFDALPFKGSKGNSFKMRDYHVLSMDRIGGEVTVHPVALDIQDVPWAARQMWAHLASLASDAINGP